MRERALLVNAELAIASPEGDGTEVRLVIPSPASAWSHLALAGEYPRRGRDD
jgi:hypothetical protein